MNRAFYYDRTKKNIVRIERESSGRGEIGPDVVKLIDESSMNGLFSTDKVFSKDPVFSKIVICRKTLEEHNFDVFVEKRGELIISIKIGWAKEDPNLIEE